MQCFTGQVIPAEKVRMVWYIHAAQTGYLRLVWKTRQTLNKRVQDSIANKVRFFFKLEYLPAGFEIQGLLMTRFMNKRPVTSCSQNLPF